MATRESEEPRGTSNETVFRVLVPDRASVWRALAGLFESGLVDPAGVPIGDITDLLDLVQFCRGHGQEVEARIESDGHVTPETLIRLLAVCAVVCESTPEGDLISDLAAVPDFSLAFDLCRKGALTPVTVEALQGLESDPLVRRYVTRGALDPDNTGISYQAEAEIIDPFDLKTLRRGRQAEIRKFLDTPEAFIRGREALEGFLEPDRRHACITFKFPSGFIQAYALCAMDLIAAAVPQCGIYGGEPEDPAMPAALPLCEHNQIELRLQDRARARSLLSTLLGGSLLVTPGERTVTRLRLANEGQDLLRLKDLLGRSAQTRAVADEAVLHHGEISRDAYLAVAQEVWEPDVPEPLPEGLREATHAAVELVPPEEVDLPGQKALQERDRAFAVQVEAEFPEEAEVLESSELGKRANVSLGREEGESACVIHLEIHWRYTAYFTDALEALARREDFQMESEEPLVYRVR